MNEKHRYLKPALLASLSALILAGCGNGSNDPNNHYVSTQPLSVVLKPGETEWVQVTSNSHDSPGFIKKFLKPGDISANGTNACVTPDPKCNEIDFEAAITATSNLLDIVEFSFTGSPLVGDQSLLPISTFPASTQTLPPAIRFAAGGRPDADGLITHIGKIGFSLSVAADGSIWGWGINDHGQLGNGSVLPGALPRQVQHPGNFAAIAAGGEHAMAIDSNGAVWTWGYNLRGQLGVETEQYINPLPLQVVTLANIIAIAAGDSHSLALDANGNVWSWGNNFYGQLGYKTLIERHSNTPKLLTDMTNIVAIAAGDSHSLALDSAGRVWAWGKNYDGQVAGRDGDGNPSNQRSPTAIQNLSSATTIAAGEGYSLLVTTDGRVMSWGANDFGQLGRASSPPCNLSGGARCSIGAVPVTGLDQVLDVAAGSRFAVARRSDGTVWAWGDNEFGQVAGLPGLSTRVARPIPELDNILRIEAGSAHAIAMSSNDSCNIGNGRTGGKLMAWGNNLFGARGDGTGANWIRPTPVLSIGDDNSCSGLTGHRVIIYKAGTGNGTIESNIPGLTCTGMICWQAISEGVDVTLTATPDAGSEFSDWSWDCSAQTQSMTMSVDSAKVCKVHFNQTATIPPPTPATCEDGIDNDGDGLIDLNDPGCSSAFDDTELGNTACDDGIDNDGDGLIDLNDSGCDSAEDDSEANNGSTFALTINITGSGEVFDNDDSSYFCFSDSNTSCVRNYPQNSTASLRGISFEVEGVGFWNGCSNGTGSLVNCTVSMDRNRTVTIDMQ